MAAMETTPNAVHVERQGEGSQEAKTCGWADQPIEEPTGSNPV